MKKLKKYAILTIAMPAMFGWLIRHSFHKDAKYAVPKPIHAEGERFILTIITCNHCGKSFRLRTEKTSQK